MIDRNFRLRAVYEDHCALRGKAHQRFQRVGGFSLGTRFEKFSDGDQHKDHRSGFKIKTVHIRLAVPSAGNVRGHGEQRTHAVYERSAGTERNKRIHIRRAVYQTFDAGNEKLLVDDHHSGCKEHLNKPHRNVVALEERGERPAPHHMSHGKVHQYQQECGGGDQPADQFRRFGICERVRVFCGGYG